MGARRCLGGGFWGHLAPITRPMRKDKRLSTDDVLARMAEHNTKALLTAQDKEKAALKMETVANKMTDHLNKTVQKNMETQHFVFVHVEGVPIEKRPKLKVSTLQHVLKTLGIPRKAFQFAKQNATLIASVADHFNLPRLSLTKVRK